MPHWHDPRAYWHDLRSPTPGARGRGVRVGEPEHPELAAAAAAAGQGALGLSGTVAVDGRGVGFAVLGGLFAEGIDLPGSRLIGAFIATLGLPQTNAANDAMQARLESAFGAGYDYAYLYPGLRKSYRQPGASSVRQKIVASST